MTYEERIALREAISAELRRRLRRRVRIERELAELTEPRRPGGVRKPLDPGVLCTASIGASGVSGYRKGCRCDDCRRAASDARRDREKRAAA